MNISETNPENEYIKTFAAFSGEDLIVTINDKVVGELAEVKWEEDFFAPSEYTITGQALFVVFKDEISLYELAKQKKSFNISMVYRDEDGNQLAYLIQDCLLTKRSSTHGVNDVIINEIYNFKAKKIKKFIGEKANKQIELMQKAIEVI